MTGPAGPRRIYFLIFISSLSSLSYELALVRTFSITLWYHFAFMVISIAMLGIGASGTALTLFPRLKDLRLLPAFGLALAAAVPLSYLAANAVPFDPARLAWDRLQLLYIGLDALVLSIPFFCFGLVVSTAFSTLGENPGTVYAADLLGAGTGSLLMFWLLFQGGPETSVLVASSLIAAAVMFIARSLTRAAAGALLLIDLAVLVVVPSYMEPALSPYKPLQVALSFPGARIVETFHSPYARVDVFESPAVRFAPGLSLRYLDPLPPQQGIAVDGGDIQAITKFSRPGDRTFLDWLPASLPYHLSRPDEVLVLEPKGGLQVAMAAHSRPRSIVALESNPLILETIRHHDLIGGAPDAGTLFASGLARSWLASSGRLFDIIDLAVPGAFPSASFGFAEDYRFTREAFQAYLRGLRPGGVLSITLYILPPPRLELRLLATIAEAANDLDIGDIASRVAAVRSWGTVTILFKRSPWSSDELEALRRFCVARRFDLVTYPGIGLHETNRYVRLPDDAYFNAFRMLLNDDTRKRFIDGYLFDISPATDARPFSHYYLKLGNIRETYRVMGEKWQFFFEEGYLLPVLFVQAGSLGFVLMLLPLFARRTGAPGLSGSRIILSLLYFGMLGFAYLFIETAIIQKMILVLEHPAYAASTAIASVLISSGIGSYAGQRMDALRRPVVLLFLAGAAAVYGCALPALGAAISPAPLSAKIVTVFVSLLPAGFLMGLPLPLGMGSLAGSSPSVVPWAWAVNGCCSVLSPVLAVMIALTVGYDAVIFIGAGLYLAGFLILRTMMEQTTGVAGSEVIGHRSGVAGHNR